MNCVRVTQQISGSALQFIITLNILLFIKISIQITVVIPIVYAAMSIQAKDIPIIIFANFKSASPSLFIISKYC